MGCRAEIRSNSETCILVSMASQNDKYIRGKLLGKGSFGSAILVTSKADGKQHVIKEIDVSRMPRAERESAELEAKVGSDFSLKFRTSDSDLLQFKNLDTRRVRTLGGMLGLHLSVYGHVCQIKPTVSAKVTTQSYPCKASSVHVNNHKHRQALQSNRV